MASNLSMLKRERGAIRRSLTLISKKPDAELRLQLAAIQDAGERLFDINQKIYAEMSQDEDITEDVWATELDAVEQYRRLFFELKDRAGESEDNEPTTDDPDHVSVHGSHVSGQNSTTDVTVPKDRPVDQYKMPKIKWMQYDGSTDKWIQFWAFFQSIHENETYSEYTKYQYLLQSTAGKAKELVEGYPPIPGNYDKIIDVMKSRFAKEDVLIDLYIRQLLKIVCTQISGQGHVCLSELYDKLQSSINNLESLGVTTDKFAIVLLPLVESAIPTESLQEWERRKTTNAFSCLNLNDDDSPSILTKLMSFLRLEVETAEKIASAHAPLQPSSVHKPEPVRFEATAASLLTASNQSGNPDYSCLFCKGHHYSQQCRKARNMSLDERKKLVLASRVCFVCLRLGHWAQKCPSQVSCQLCGGRHVLLMCPDVDLKQPPRQSQPKRKERKKTAPPTDRGEQPVAEEKTNNGLAATMASPVSLMTASVKIRSAHGALVTCRVLFDQGCHYSYLKDDFAKKLGLQPQGAVTLTHCLFGGVESPGIRHSRYFIEVADLDGNFKDSFHILGQKQICSPVQRVQDPSILTILESERICLADQGGSDIDMLIGSDLYASFLTGEILPIKGRLRAINTHFGWTLSGAAQEPFSAHSCLTMSTVLTTSLCCSSVDDFWSLEVMGIHAAEEPAPVTQFRRDLIVNADGRYEVSLPWHVPPNNLGHNFMQAKARLTSLMKKFQNQPAIMEQYDEVFQQWTRDGIIREVICSPEHPQLAGHYLCHRPVIRDTSATTKVRPVFDGSAKSETGLSLNECLEKGENLIAQIPPILLRFRMGQIGIIADIQQAFLQISLRESDRDYLKFLWRDKIYQHCRVVFGLTPSPYLLSSVLNVHLESVPEPYRETASQLLKSFYVDDCVTSVDNVTQLQKFVTQAKFILKEGCFELRKWRHTAVSHDPPEGVDCCEHNSDIVSVLGLSWHLSSDFLNCSLKTLEPLSIVTKTIILSTTMKIFDPIGFTAPVTVLPKLLLQQTCQLKLPWDAAVPSCISTPFRQWYQVLPDLNLCNFDRCLFPSDFVTRTLHVFCDASKIAYAACVFVRSVTPDRIVVRLISAKSRITPCKPTLSIPRAELMAAVLAVRLYSAVCAVDEFRDLEATFYSDSMVVLAWLENLRSWKPFVSHRVQEIRRIADFSKWRHVPGIANPADLLSRGCDAASLREQRWWDGPAWLSQPSSEWPIGCKQLTPDEEAQILREATVHNMVTVTPAEPASTFQHYWPSVRAVGWMLRWRKLVKRPHQLKPYITGSELRAAERALIHFVQAEAIELHLPEYQRLNLVKDDADVYRVKTKLIFGEQTYDFRYPILMPRKHPVTKALIWETHESILHAGVGNTLVALRARHWIPKGRKTVKEFLQKCVICKTVNARAIRVPMAPLPIERFTANRPFQVTGVDLAGPLHVFQLEKTWIVLFTCAVYRGIHLELVRSLSTDDFIMALRRFVSRRGRPDTVFSDNGTNFVGTHNALSELDWARIEHDPALKCIDWRFNPPSAPWWGGFWERLVRVIKDLLKKCLRKRTVSYDQLHTIVTDIEGIVNSRPLTYMADGEDFVPLTPAIFMNNVFTVEMPDFDQIDRQSLVVQLQQAQVIREDLRRRFQSEYLGCLLAQRDKEPSRLLQPGEIVLVGSDNVKRIKWPLARVIEIYAGPDGFSRVARLRTANGELVRPLQRLYPLELQANDPLVAAGLQQHKAHPSVSPTLPVVDPTTANVVNPDPPPPVAPIPRSPPAPTKRTRTRLVKLPTRFQQ